LQGDEKLGSKIVLTGKTEKQRVMKRLFFLKKGEGLNGAAKVGRRWWKGWNDRQCRTGVWPAPLGCQGGGEKEMFRSEDRLALTRR
jgi:hypothetical protein